MTDQLFCALDSQRIADLVRSAQRFVCYAGPGIRTMPAQAMVEVAAQIGPEMVTVALDFDERVLRMGFGDFEAVKRLRDAGILINNAPGLRSAFLLVDDEGYVFTPFALYLESEPAADRAVNAMRLSPEQLREALARLSPGARDIAKAQAKTEQERQRIAAIPVEINSQPVDQKTVERVGTSLNEAPPVKFDVERQVRVYNAYLQYVDLKLTGAAIQHRKVTVPSSIMNLGDGKDMEGRLRTTYDLIQKDADLSSKKLDDELQQIRKDFTPSLGKNRGRVVLKAQKENLKKRLEALQTKLDEHQKKVEAQLQSHLDESRSQIVSYYVKRAHANPPDSMRGQLSSPEPTEQDAKAWLIAELDKVFPKAEALVQKMKLHEDYKDVTIETLRAPEFLVAVKKAFPRVNWEKTHEEYLAAGEAKA